jgi:heterodisulfide reductase subunit C
MSVTEEIVKVIDGSRRFLMRKLSKNYIKNKLKKRKGKCLKCGVCCIGCPFLNKKTHLCKIYKKRPALMCYKDFPLDRIDQKIWHVEKICGYKFED